jgi:hypothetical protein
MDGVTLTWRTRESDKEQNSIDVSDICSVCIAHMHLQLYYHSNYRCVLTQSMDAGTKIEINFDAVDLLKQPRRDRALSSGSPSSSSKGSEEKGFFNRGLSAMLGRKKPGPASEVVEKAPSLEFSSADEDDYAGNFIAVLVTQRNGSELLVKGSDSNVQEVVSWLNSLTMVTAVYSYQ